MSLVQLLKSMQGSGRKHLFFKNPHFQSSDFEMEYTANISVVIPTTFSPVPVPDILQMNYIKKLLRQQLIVVDL